MADTYVCNDQRDRVQLLAPADPFCQQRHIRLETRGKLGEMRLGNNRSLVVLCRPPGEGHDTQPHRLAQLQSRGQQHCALGFVGLRE